MFLQRSKFQRITSVDLLESGAQVALGGGGAYVQHAHLAPSRLHGHEVHSPVHWGTLESHVHFLPPHGYLVVVVVVVVVVVAVVVVFVVVVVVFVAAVTTSNT